MALASRHFKNISIDLIYGVPYLSEQRWMDNLKQTFDLGVAHISSYALTVEPKTAMDHFIKSGKYPPLDESLAKSHFEILQKETSDRNYIQYEISNFGFECTRQKGTHIIESMFYVESIDPETLQPVADG